MNRLTKVINSEIRYKETSVHTYVDLNTVNNSSTRKPVLFQNLRSGTIINNSQDYYVYVCRLSIDTVNSLPIWIPTIDLTANDVNQCLNSFTMTYKNYIFQQPLMFAPQKINEVVPINANYQDISSTEYYYVYSYSYVIGLLNQCLEDCFNGLKALANAGNDATINGCSAPYLIYDQSSGEVMLQSLMEFYDQKSAANPVFLYMNQTMFSMLSSFEYSFVGESATQGMNYKVLIYNNNGLNVYENGNNVNFLQTYQEYPCINMWSPIESIVLTGQNISIQPNIYTQPQQFNTALNFSDNTSVNETVNALTDFKLANSTEYLPSITYSPSVFRLIDMVGHISYNNIMINCLWVDIWGDRHTMYLNPSSKCSLKLCFRLKSEGL